VRSVSCPPGTGYTTAGAISCRIYSWAPYRASYQFDTPHSYPDNYAYASNVLVVSGAVGYAVAFSSSTSVYVWSWPGDVFKLYSESGSMLFQGCGYYWSSFQSTYIRTTTGFYWTFTTDTYGTAWGVQFMVTPVCANGFFFSSLTATCVACTVLGTSTTGATVGQTQTACSACAAGSYVVSAGAACTPVPAGT